MIHGDAVTDPDGSKFYRSSAGHVDPCLYSLRDGVQVNMTGNCSVKGIGDADQRPFNFLIRVSDSFKQGPVRCPFNTFFCCVALHPASIPFCMNFQKKIRYRLWGDNGFRNFRCWLV
jgi:hypothetical protein